MRELKNPVLLLPPSEAKLIGGASSFNAATGQFAGLAASRRRVARALRTAMDDPSTVATITGLRSARAELAAATNRVVLGAPALPAASRYSGVLWSHLEPASLSPRARHRASGIVVFSALGGLFAFDDPVPDYKLKMGARLDPLGPLAGFWRPRATAALRAFADERVIWDVLPDEHRRAVTLDTTVGGAQICVEFRAASGSRAAGHQAKAAKGCFVRHLLEATSTGLDAAEDFTWEGWRGEVHTPELVVVRAPD